MSLAHPRPTRAFVFPGLLVMAVLAAGCSSTGSASPEVTGAWVRPSTGLSVPVAAYLVISNPGGPDDALIGASSPVAQTVEIHDTMTMNGMTGMSPVDRVPLAKGATAALKPDGMHLMLIGLTRPLVVGDRVELDLVFEHAGRIAVQAAVRQN